MVSSCAPELRARGHRPVSSRSTHGARGRPRRCAPHFPCTMRTSRLLSRPWVSSCTHSHRPPRRTPTTPTMPTSRRHLHLQRRSSTRPPPPTQSRCSLAHHPPSTGCCPTEGVCSGAQEELVALPILSNEHPLSLPIWVGSNAAIALAYLFDLNPLNARTAWHTGCPDRMAPGCGQRLLPTYVRQAQDRCPAPAARWGAV